MSELSKPLLVTFLFLILSACASNSSKPDWLNEPYSQHPKSRYLVATASADNSNDADSRALAGLARSFEVAIQDQTLDFNKASINSRDGKREITNEQSVGRTINAFSSQVLEGASVDQRWRSEQGEHHSLAVLNKQEAARRFRTRLQEIDRDTSMLFARSNSAPNIVTKLSALEQARKLQIDRLQIDRNLSVVASAGISSRYSESYLRDRIKKILAAQRFAIQAKPSKLTTQLQSAVVQVGSKVNQSAAYTLQGHLDLNPIDKKQNWYWLRGALVLSLEYQGKIIAKQRIEIKESSTQHNMLSQRLFNKLTANMGNHFYALLTSAQDMK